MKREDVFVLAGWSSDSMDICMTEQNHPLSLFATERAEELEGLLTKIDHQPIDHKARATVDVCVELRTSLLTYEVESCCEKCDENIYKIIDELNHHQVKKYRVRLNTTFRQRIEE